MKDKLESEYQYFLDNQQKLIEQYKGQYIVIKNKSVIEAYDDEVTAFTETTKEHEPGTFIIQKASEDSTKTQVFHSRVVSRW